LNFKGWNWKKNIKKKNIYNNQKFEGQIW
jgi:hypothetical protein